MNTKNKIMKKLMATIAVVSLIIGGAMAQEQGEMRTATEGRKFEKHGHHAKLMDQIPDLTEKQKADLKTIKQETRKQTEPKRAELKTIQSKIAEIKLTENPDQQEINRLIDRSSAIKADIEKTRTASELKARSILTPEQQAAFNQLMKEGIEQKEKRHMEHKQMKQREVE